MCFSLLDQLQKPKGLSKSEEQKILIYERNNTFFLIELFRKRLPEFPIDNKHFNFKQTKWLRELLNLLSEKF